MLWQETWTLTSIPSHSAKTKKEMMFSWETSGHPEKKLRRSLLQSSLLRCSFLTMPRSPRELTDGTVLPSSKESNTSGKTNQHTSTTLPSSRPSNWNLVLLRILKVLMFWVTLVTPSPLITSHLLETSPRILQLADIFLPRASLNQISIPTVLVEETMKSWLEELLLIPDSSTRWSTRLAQRPSTSQVARNSPSSMLLLNIKLKEANLLSLLETNTDQDPPEIGLLRALTSKVSRQWLLKATRESTDRI